STAWRRKSARQRKRSSRCRRWWCATGIGFENCATASQTRRFHRSRNGTAAVAKRAAFSQPKKNTLEERNEGNREISHSDVCAQHRVDSTDGAGSAVLRDSVFLHCRESAR